MKLDELSIVCDLQNGYAFKSKDYVDISNTVSLRMSNIRPDGNFDSNYNLRYLPDDFQEKYSNYIIKDGDLVIAMTDLANDPKILGVPTIVETGKYIWLLNQRAGKLIIKDEEKADKNYLRYILNHPIHRNYYKMFSGGGLQINVGKKEILGCKIPLPPLKTQQRIAEILDNAAALRDKTAQLLTEYDLLAQSIFLEMFGDPVLNPKGWEKTELVKLCPLVKNSVSPEEIKDNTNYVGLDSIEKHSGEIHTIQTVKENELKSNKYLFSSEHILYGKLRPYLNKVANPSFNGICSTDIITLLPNQKKTNKAFVTNYLRGKWHVNWANNNTSGANLPRLNLTQFSRLKIMNPPIKLQNQFADKIALIEQQKALAKQELQQAEDLFNCLLQKAFKGEL